MAPLRGCTELRGHFKRKGCRKSGGKPYQTRIYLRMLGSLRVTSPTTSSTVACSSLIGSSTAIRLSAQAEPRVP